MITLNVREAAIEAAALRKAERAERGAKALAASRAYQAGVVNRLNSDWTINPSGTRYELRQFLRNIRARSRDMARNSDYVKKFLGMVKTNVVGPAGIKLQVRAQLGDRLHQNLNKKVEAAWREWGHKETCSASGKLSWLDAQRLFVSTLARDGEVLVRKMAARNKFGFSLKFIDVNWLDETFNAILEGGNRIIMSVEVDADARPVAYWLTPPADEYAFPGAIYDGTGMRHRVRVPADEMIHAYLVDDENQTRGVPWAHTAMLRLKILNGYEEAELVAARTGACKGGIITSPDDDEYDGPEGEEPEIVEQIEPGMLPVLPPGYQFQEYDPNHPNGNYGAFVKACLRGIASGLEVSYTSLANDLEGVNYSSIRAGLLEERDVWKALQNFVIEHFCRPVYLAWLQGVLLNQPVPLLAGEYARILDPVWQARGWKWVDPMKDVQATILAVNNGLESRTDALAEQGDDFEDVVAQLAHEQEVLKEAGLQLAPEKPAAPSADVAAPADEEEGDEE